MRLSPDLSLELRLAADEHGLLSVARYRELGGDPRALREACASGLLTRVRLGIYCDSTRWGSLSAREQHVLRVRAALAQVGPEFRAAGTSAAAVWDLPIFGTWPPTVTLLGPYRGGGRSDPGVRRVTAGFETAEPVEHDGVRVTSRARTALQLASAGDFLAGVMATDAVLAAGAPRAELWREFEGAGSRLATRAAARAIEFADGASESPGESAARAAIFLAGFESPELQVEFVDAEGVMRADFAWADRRILGEFDGKQKYERERNGGEDAQSVLWREKLREDRLRRQADAMVRLVWADVMSRERLARVLDAGGVPRRGASHAQPRDPRPDRVPRAALANARDASPPAQVGVGRVGG